MHTSFDSRTAIVFVSEGSERVKTATLSFKLNQAAVRLLVLVLDLDSDGRTNLSFNKETGRCAGSDQTPGFSDRRSVCASLLPVCVCGDCEPQASHGISIAGTQ